MTLRSGFIWHLINVAAMLYFLVTGVLILFTIVDPPWFGSVIAFIGIGAFQCMLLWSDYQKEHQIPSYSSSGKTIR
jgi:hypothetical protein